MIRIVCRPKLMAVTLVAASLVVACRAMADGPEDDQGSRLTVMADFNRDGIADIARVVPAENQSGVDVLTVSLGRVDGTFQEMAPDAILGHAPRAIVAGDFNRDGIADVIVGDDDGSLKLFVGDGTGKLISGGNVAYLGSVASIAVADFNHDGIPDLAISDWRSSAVTIFTGVGNGSFERGWSFPLRMPGTVPHVAVADFNGDGIPDLAVVYGDDGQYTFDVLVGNGKGAFTKAPDLGFTRDPNSHCPT
jgi:hypothetical protein